MESNSNKSGPRWRSRKSEPAKGQSLATIKDIASTAQSIVAIVAIIMAGIWFLRRDLEIPRANLSHYVESVKLNEKWQWVRLTVTFENTGEVPAYLTKGQIYMQRVLPLELAMSSKLEKDGSLVDPDTHILPWSTIGDPYNVVLDAKVDPKEIETYEYDFVVPVEICDVVLYSYFDSDTSRNLGWSKSTISKVGGCKNAG